MLRSTEQGRPGELGKVAQGELGLHLEEGVGV